MSLSVCLLTRNQEHDIARSIRSVAGLADEVIVVDTASTDRTAEVAAELGAKVRQFPWDDDFAAGRNFALGQATGDWVLWLNADEELLPASHQPARECMARPDVFGYFVVVQTPAEADPSGPFSETTDLRLFRRRPDLRFVGRVYPHLDPMLAETIRRAGEQVTVSAVTLRSAAPPAERGEAKLRWTARLLELELRDRPGQLPYLIEYGRTLLLLDDPKGHGVLAEAAEQVAAAHAAPVAPSLKVQVLLEYLLTAPPELCRARLSREEARALALRWFPASAPLLYKIAEDCFRKGEYHPAAGLLERLVRLGETGEYDRSRRFDPGLVGDDALVNLAACYRQLGDLAAAEQCYRRLLGSRHFQAQAAEGLAAVQALRQRQGGGLSFDAAGGPRT